MAEISKEDVAELVERLSDGTVGIDLNKQAVKTITAISARVEELEREAASRNTQLDGVTALWNECQEARDAVGFLGSVPDCIKHLAAAAERERSILARLNAHEAMVEALQLNGLRGFAPEDVEETLAALASVLSTERQTQEAGPTASDLCEDCPPDGYPTDATRCAPCPRRQTQEGE